MKKVLLGFSGGVDSAVSAILLKKEGYEVTGCFMRNWDALANNDYLGNPTINNNQCPQEKDYDDAKIAAEIIGIPLLRVDFIKEYWDNVFSFFIKEYKEGRTPNPDVLCNKYIKFDSFLQFAKSKGFDYIAMGHYAKKVLINDEYYLSKPFDKEKDQTYFLSQLNKEQIKYCLFPLGDINKTEVRKIANDYKLNIANKKDSTGVCFIGERHFKEFLNNYIPAKKGKIIEINTNRILGEHNGAFYYTIGQRKGLGIGGISNEKSEGWVVIKKDVKRNIVYVSKGNTDKYLKSNKIIISYLNILMDLKENDKLTAKFRYREKDNNVIVKSISKEKIELLIPEYATSIATGQFAVLYKNDILIGGGIIAEVYNNNLRIDK